MGAVANVRENLTTATTGLNSISQFCTASSPPTVFTYRAPGNSDNPTIAVTCSLDTNSAPVYDVTFTATSGGSTLASANVTIFDNSPTVGNELETNGVVVTGWCDATGCQYLLDRPNVSLAISAYRHVVMTALP